MNLVRSEWIKLSTVRVNYVLGGVAAAFPIVVISLTSLLSGHVDEAANDLTQSVTVTMVLSSLVLGVIGALNLTSEYSHGTIRVTFAATPQRRDVLLTKALVTAVTTAVFSAVVELASFGIGVLVLSARGSHIEITSDDSAAMLGSVVLAMMLAMLGFGLGLVIRHSAATIAILLLWPLLLESILRAILTAAGVDNPTPWLPYQSAFSMVAVDRDPGDPSRLRAGLFLGLIAIALIVIGINVNDRRDA